jgi:hypothetical protein
MNSNVAQWITAQSAVALAEVHGEFETLSDHTKSAVESAVAFAATSYLTGGTSRTGLADHLVSEGYRSIAAESAVAFAVKNTTVAAGL